MSKFLKTTPYIHIITKLNISLTYYCKFKVLSELCVEMVQETAIISDA